MSTTEGAPKPREAGFVHVYYGGGKGKTTSSIGLAVRAAGANRLQTSFNLAIGSALACIGLTVPLVVLASVLLDLPLVLGLQPMAMAMLVLTFVVSAFTLGTGRTYLMQGAVHLVLFAAFLFLAFVP